MKKNAQNLIEFVFVFPLVVLLVLAIFELAMFYRTVHAVQNVALKAAANAATQIVTSDMTEKNMVSFYPAVNPNFNLAALKALNTVWAKEGALDNSKTKAFTATTDDSLGLAPYTLYTFKADQTVVNSEGVTKPVIELRVDYSDPTGKGIITQLIYQYTTLIFSAAVPLPDGRSMTIIPNHIEISSTKIQQYNQF